MAVELATAYVSLVPSAKGMTSGIQKEMGGAEGAAEEAGGKAGGRFGSGFMGKAKSALAVGGGGLVAAIGAVKIGDALLDKSAEVVAWRQKTRTVFEGQAGDVKAWAKENAASFGVSADNLSGLAANFGDLLKPMGFTSSQAASMATDVVGLSGALSSWSGGTKSAAEVSQVLAKAMLGERDGLKELGISISENDVQARLAKKGQQNLTGAALEQAKAVATQELIMEKSTDAQKAWADGGNASLKAGNRLKSMWQTGTEWVAMKFTPAIVAAAGWLADKLPVAGEKARSIIAAIKPPVSKIVAGFKSVVAAVKPVVSAFVGFVRDNPKPVLIGLAAAIGTVLVAAFVAWAAAAIPAAVATLAAAAPLLLLVAAVALVAGGLVWAYQNIDWFRGAVDKVASFLRDTAWPLLQKVAGWLKDVFVAAVATLAGWWSDHLYPAIQTVAGFFTGTVLPALSRVASFISGTVVPTVVTIVSTFIDVATSVKDRVDAIVGFVLSIPGRIGATVSGLWVDLKNGITVARDWVRDRIDDVVDFATGLPGRIGSAFLTLADAISQPFRKAFNLVAGWWNDTVGGFGFEVPGWVPLVGGKTFEIPRMPVLHTGGVVPGRPGDEVAAILEAGEWVLSRDQVRSLTRTPPAQPATAGPSMFFDNRGITNAEQLAPLISRQQAWAMRMVG